MKRHLTAARDTLSQLTQLPAAAQLTGDARTQVSQLISNFNELITTNVDWRASYAKLQGNLNALVGEQRADESPARAATGTAGAVGTSGTVTIDPAIRAKLIEFRANLAEFEKAAGGSGSPSTPAAKDPAAAARGAERIGEHDRGALGEHDCDALGEPHGQCGAPRPRRAQRPRHRRRPHDRQHRADPCDGRDLGHGHADAGDRQSAQSAKPSTSGRDGPGQRGELKAGRRRPSRRGDDATSRRSSAIINGALASCAGRTSSAVAMRQSGAPSAPPACQLDRERQVEQIRSGTSRHLRQVELNKSTEPPRATA